MFEVPERFNAGTLVDRNLEAGRGAPLVDADCAGTAIRDFRNVADESTFEEETVVRLFGAPPPGAMLVFGQQEAARSAKAATEGS